MRVWKVDVPVAVFIWTRPELQRKQFEVIKKVRPRVLLLLSDGGRNTGEWEKINISRKMYDEKIDWECEVFRQYESKNQGVYIMEDKCQKFVWQHVDRCIFLEDDVIPSVSYFKFCEELLERYKDDYRVCWISGMNMKGVYKEVTSDYFFTKTSNIWGYATWKRVYDRSYGNFEYVNDPYVMGLLEDVKKYSKVSYNKLKYYPTNPFHGGHNPDDEFFYGAARYLENQLYIVPKVNLIRNMGLEDSAHSDRLENMPRGLRKIFLLKGYELKFPLKHPQYMVNDSKYEAFYKRTMAVGHPLISAYRKVERALLLIRHGEMNKVVRKVKDNINRKVGNKVDD